jgi:hypothetical protein
MWPARRPVKALHSMSSDGDTGPFRKAVGAAGLPDRTTARLARRDYAFLLLEAGGGISVRTRMSTHDGN